MKPILFHPDAEAEFDHSIEFYNKRQFGLGLDFEREIVKALSSIHHNPERWPVCNWGLRKFILHHFPYIIYYLDEPNFIWIVAIAHCSRKPDYWLKRL